MTDPLEVLTQPGSLLAELRAARDLHLTRHVDGDGVTDPDHVVAATTWSEAISIVERFVNPMLGLEPGDLTRIRDSLPCLPGERHTFDAGAKACLCRALTVGIVSRYPTACLYAPTGEVAS